MITQKETWEKIAPEWAEFKISPAEHTKRFLEEHENVGV